MANRAEGVVSDGHVTRTMASFRRQLNSGEGVVSDGHVTRTMASFRRQLNSGEAHLMVSAVEENGVRVDLVPAEERQRNLDAAITSVDEIPVEQVPTVTQRGDNVSQVVSETVGGNVNSRNPRDGASQAVTRRDNMRVRRPRGRLGLGGEAQSAEDVHQVEILPVQVADDDQLGARRQATLRNDAGGGEM